MLSLGTLYRKIVENDKPARFNSLRGLHNDVYINIGIIDKKSKNAQIPLNFNSFWSIVSMHPEFWGFFMHFSLLLFSTTVEVIGQMLQTGKSGKIAFLHNVSTYLLTCAFLFGYLTGCAVTCSDSLRYNSLIQCASSTPASAVALAAHVIVPFLLTYLIFRLGRTELIHILCFILAFGYGMVSVAVNRTFGSAYWLIHPLLLFTATTTLGFLLHFWLRLISSQSKNPEKELLFYFGFAVLSSAADYFLVSPFLLSLYS